MMNDDLSTHDPYSLLVGDAAERERGSLRAANTFNLLARVARRRPLHPHELVLQSDCLRLTEDTTGSLADIESFLRAAVSIDASYVPALLELAWFNHRVQNDAGSGIRLFMHVIELCDEWMAEARSLETLLQGEERPPLGLEETEEASSRGDQKDPRRLAIQERYAPYQPPAVGHLEIVKALEEGHEVESRVLPPQDFEKRLAHLEEVARYRQLHPNEHLARGKCLLIVESVGDRWMRAEAALQAALGLDPDYLPAYLELAWFNQTIRRNPASAAEYLEKARVLLEEWHEEAEAGANEAEKELEEIEEEDGKTQNSPKSLTDADGLEGRGPAISEEE